MKSMKRILSVLLAVVLLLGVVPVMQVGVTASAAGGVKARLDTFMQSYPAGGRWTGSFDGGRECYGFGKMVIYNIFGKYSGSKYRSWTYAGVSTSGMTAIGSITNFSSSNVQSLLSSAKCGDILQFNTTKQHTMVIYSVNSSSVTIYDCNWDGNCGISKRDCSFGAWAGRNSSKLTLLRADNYSSVDGSSDYFFDVNVNINGEQFLNGHSSTTFDVYINGALVGNDVQDFSGYYTSGTTYTVTDIKVYGTYKYNGNSSYSGTINAAVDINLPVSDLKQNIGNDFYAYIIKLNSWKHLEASSDVTQEQQLDSTCNVQIAKGGNNCYDPRQVWHFIFQSDGSYKIQNMYDDACLDVYSAFTDNNTNVITTKDDHGGSNQRWYVYAMSGGYRLVPAHALNKSLDVSYDENEKD